MLNFSQSSIKILIPLVKDAEPTGDVAQPESLMIHLVINSQ